MDHFAYVAQLDLSGGLCAHSTVLVWWRKRFKVCRGIEWRWDHAWGTALVIHKSYDGISDIDGHLDIDVMLVSNWCQKRDLIVHPATIAIQKSCDPTRLGLPAIEPRPTEVRWCLGNTNRDALRLGHVLALMFVITRLQTRMFEHDTLLSRECCQDRVSWPKNTAFRSWPHTQYMVVKLSTWGSW